MSTGREIDFINDGLLWLINRQVFHPRGYALAIDKEKDRWILIGDGSEPWNFVDGDEGKEFAATKRLMP